MFFQLSEFLKLLKLIHNKPIFVHVFAMLKTAKYVIIMIKMAALNFRKIRDRTQISVQMLRRFIRSLIIVSAIILYFNFQVFALPPAPRFGLWVEAENSKVKPFDSSAEFERLMSYLERQDITDIYCQVYRRGRAWYSSMLADDTPFYKALADGLNPLQDIIRFAKSRGIRVHAWINLLRIKDNWRAPIFSVVGKSAALMDNYGNSLIDYSHDGNPPSEIRAGQKLGTPGIWLDPGNPRVRKYMVELIRELIINYPELDGVHLDMVRFPVAISKRGYSRKPPGLMFGFGNYTLRNFVAGGGTVNEAKQGSFTWQDWRRGQLTLLLMELRETIEHINPAIELSAAVLSPSERAYKNALQDWSSWLAGNILDTVIPMAYTRSARSFKTRSLDAVNKRRDPQQILIGIGAWLMRGSSSELRKQVTMALRNGSDGVVFFSYANLADKKGEATIEQSLNVFRKEGVKLNK